MEQLERKKHWDSIYSTKESDQVSWFQTYPKTSIEFIRLFDLPFSAKIIDVGGGDSNLIDTLIDLGYSDLTVLDISKEAINRTKMRLGEKAKLVKWIVSDVTEFIPLEKYDLWHDRAAFHFLTTEALTDKYVEIAKRGIKENGYLILGTFSENGPKKCSGLDIKQYSEHSMSDKFTDGFDRIRCIQEDHLTPFNTVQNFLFCSFRRNSNSIIL
jgi:SAM-dependent methyltransferase